MNYKDISASIPTGVTLVAVSKTKPAGEILKIYEQGQRVFGENKVQEMVDKYEQLPKNIEWHLIGHLQTNKVKYIAPFVTLIHAIDSLKLLAEVNKQAKKNQRTINCLLQFHIAQEETKFGLSIEEAQALLASETYQEMEHIQICGVMGMASFTTDQEQVASEFELLNSYFKQLKNNYFANDSHFQIKSMGMSGDYQLAIEHGSNMVRIGSLIFGAR